MSAWRSDEKLVILHSLFLLLESLCLTRKIKYETVFLTQYQTFPSLSYTSPWSATTKTLFLIIFGGTSKTHETLPQQEL